MRTRARTSPVIGAAILTTALGCTRQPADVGREKALFVEMTAAASLDDSPPQWPAGLYAIPEISAGGIALFDYDGDDDLDIYQVRHPPPDRPGAPAPNRLLRHEPGGAFREAPASGLEDAGYGNGVAVGDADNDGAPDVFVANLGADQLYVNRRDGTFRNATEHSGIRESSWSTCAAFFDYDRDGDLDLYVAHYLVDDPSRVCRTEIGSTRDYCGPSRYQAAPDALFRNDGEATFSDVSQAAGIVAARPGFGVICFDFTGDGWPDVFVANDMEPNQLHVNRRNGTFADEAFVMGVAVNGAGSAQAGMGVATGDVNGDGRLDLFVTNLSDQTNSLFVSSESPGAGAQFRDRSASSGLGAPSLAFTGWGCGLVDIDHDGDLDVLVVDGRVARGPVESGAALGSFWNSYAERNLLFLQTGSGKFSDAREAGGDFTRRVEVTHSLAFGDLDGDGDVDAVTADAGDRVRIYRNDAPAQGTHWFRLRAITGKRDALGARVTIEAGGTRQVRPLISAYSFAAANEPVAHFGLGAATRVDSIEVLWPDGSTERFDGAAADRTLTVAEGQGKR